MSKEISKKPATLRELAKAAGVNPSTVSRAMHNDPRICVETRELIHELARKMRYTPNPYVTAFTKHARNHRALPTQATIAILDISDEHDSQKKIVWQDRYAQGIRDRASELGFSIDVLQHSRSNYQEAGRIIEARGVRGVIVMPVNGLSAIKGIDFRNIASATIDTSLQSPVLHRASPDYFQGMSLALESLRSRRYRRIGFCTHGEELRRIGQRWLGSYFSWQALNPPDERVEPCIEMGYSFTELKDPKEQEKGWKAFRETFYRWLDKEKPDAIVSNNFFFEGWLQDLGVKIPQEMGFASLGLNLETSFESGIDQQNEQVGQSAVDLVANQIFRNEYGLPHVPTNVMIPPLWLDGQTTI